MRVTLAWVGKSKAGGKQSPIAQLTAEYLKRSSRYLDIAPLEAASEAALFSAVEKLAGRTTPYLVLLDSSGKQHSSEELAGLLRAQQERGAQHLVFAVGPADGWSADARRRAGLLLSLGLITLPHELARVVLAEQIYRALTIQAGHPYHSGH